MTVQVASLGSLSLCCRMAGRTPGVTRTAVMKVPDTQKSSDPAVPPLLPRLPPLMSLQRCKFIAPRFFIDQELDFAIVCLKKKETKKEIKTPICGIIALRNDQRHVLQTESLNDRWIRGFSPLVFVCVRCEFWLGQQRISTSFLTGVCGWRNAALWIIWINNSTVSGGPGLPAAAEPPLLLSEDLIIVSLRILLHSPTHWLR